MSTFALNDIGGIVDKSLSDSKNAKVFKDTIDLYMSINFNIYSAIGPGKRPVFSTDTINIVLGSMGLTTEMVDAVFSKIRKVNSSWTIRGVYYPFNLATILALRHFEMKKDEKQVANALTYLICFNYPLIHKKFFRYEPAETTMAYTINNLSNKFQIKQLGNLWAVLYDMIGKAYNLHKKNILVGDDQSLGKFMADVRTRMSNFMLNIAKEFYTNHESGKYLQSEHESFEEDKYYESDSNTLAAERITNKVLTNLIVSGPNSKLVELSAKNCSVSVNNLRTYIGAIIDDKRREELRVVIERLVFLYLFSEDSTGHTIQEIGTNRFLIYCMKVYQKSNTIDPNVIKIKQILDKWMVEIGAVKAGQPFNSTANNVRRAIYMFFVMSIMSSC